jgi:hypothetical protein
MKKRTPKTDAEVVRSIIDLNDESKWSDAELESYLRENGVDPLQVATQIRAGVAAMLQDQPQQEPVGETQSQQASPIQNLAEEGEARGLSIKQLATACQMSLRLFAKLQSGMLNYASIPFEVFVDVGRAIGRTAEEVGEYVRLSHPSAQGAHFRAGTAPEISPQQDFFVAVKEDDSLIPEHLERFLMLEEKYKGGLFGGDMTNSNKGVSAMNEKENRNVVSKDLAPSSARLRNEVRGIADKFTDAFKEIKRRGD